MLQVFSVASKIEGHREHCTFYTRALGYPLPTSDLGPRILDKLTDYALLAQATVGDLAQPFPDASIRFFSRNRALVDLRRRCKMTHSENVARMRGMGIRIAKFTAVCWAPKGSYPARLTRGDPFPRRSRKPNDVAQQQTTSPRPK